MKISDKQFIEIMEKFYKVQQTKDQLKTYINDFNIKDTELNDISDSLTTELYQLRESLWQIKEIKE